MRDWGVVVIWFGDCSSLAMRNNYVCMDKAFSVGKVQKTQNMRSVFWSCSIQEIGGFVKFCYLFSLIVPIIFALFIANNDIKYHPKPRKQIKLELIMVVFSK